MLHVDLFWLNLCYTQDNEKKTLYVAILLGKKTPKNSYRVSKNSTEGQRKSAGSKCVHLWYFILKVQSEEVYRQPQLHACFWSALNYHSLLLNSFYLCSIQWMKEYYKGETVHPFSVEYMWIQCHCLLTTASFNIFRSLEACHRKDKWVKNHELACFLKRHASFLCPNCSSEEWAENDDGRVMLLMFMFPN